MGKLNHETRFKTNLEINNETNFIYKKFGQGLTKSDFCRAIFVLGFNTFKDKINEGFYPSYEFINYSPKIEYKKDKTI